MKITQVLFVFGSVFISSTFAFPGIGPILPPYWFPPSNKNPTPAPTMFKGIGPVIVTEKVVQINEDVVQIN